MPVLKQQHLIIPRFLPRRISLGILTICLALTEGALKAADNPDTELAKPFRPYTASPVAGRKLWLYSVDAMAVAGVLDVGSSWGKRELNTNLSGDTQTFGARGALMKLGIDAGIVGVEYLILHRRPSKQLFRTMSIINFGCASVTSGVAVRNFGIPRP